MESDEKQGFTTDVKPIIREVVRTGICFPNIQVIVARLWTQYTEEAGQKADGPRQGAICMALTDGELVIQASVKRRMQKTVADLKVRPGSILVLKDYRLEQAARIDEEGEAIIIVIADFFLAGFANALVASPEQPAAPSG